MKFSHSLQFNAVPEWKEHYLAYSALKKLIYELQELVLENDNSNTASSKLATSHTSDNDVRSNLAGLELSGAAKWKVSLMDKIGSLRRKKEEATTETLELESISEQETLDLAKIDLDKVSPTKVFETALLKELSKIDRFYTAQEKVIFSEIDRLLKDLHYYKETQDDLQRIKTNDRLDRFSKDVERDAGDDDEDDLESTTAFSTLLSDRELNLSFQHEVSYKKRIVQAFIELSELKSFIELNKIGFSKVCKKFDKVLEQHIRERFVESLSSRSEVFSTATLVKIDDYLDELVEVYAGVTQDSIEAARAFLRSHLREHIVFERSTVWKEMIGIEKDKHNAKGSSVLTGDEAELKGMFQVEMYSTEVSWLPFRLGVPKFLFGWTAFKIALTILVGGILLGVKTLNDRTQGNCLAVVAVCAILWATEAIPLFATSLLVPFLVVTCNVLKDADTGEVMGAADATSYIFSTMWNSTIMLLIGGFTLAAALSKYNIARIASSYILFFAGTSPRRILLAIMVVALFLSMWISNVAAPVLAYSLIGPLLKSIPTESGFAKALVLGIALVSDVGGMSTPISSPQNIIAIEALEPHPTWGNWFSFSIPLCLIGLFLVWLEMILTFKINTVKIKPIKPIRTAFTLKQYYICFVSVLTIVLWCLESQLESRLGSSGIISIVPIIAFYGTGLLTTTDVNNYPWSIVLLAMGGIALGKAVSSSGLLHTIATSLSDRIHTYPPIAILAIFGVLCVVFATFVSHTVSALILIPLVQSVGQELDQGFLLVCGITLIASVGMALPMSGFPNSIAISMTDDLGKRYLSTSLFISRGVPISLAMFVVIITVGYGIMSSIR
ncbi:hypothetical protein KL905_002928 [Ogataea polymorpha]|uniref:Uncharacterized protein n=1 Tax=Ogataea polymorpha TaxID=460523 RepID=A0A1B7SQP5_9ASCO|nr:uncharacterized protein OGAPODRAFT_15408 [Ogataea polymorpha]KAG7900786.1 hypothetical protein KL935_002719 [Ogataea polymorpha]KAG7916563.1 hypothetical protein KL927_003202 [Ogataea polymorpha]KAG7921470.1 hypothetical protein KL905_002928 [Ogataea polymorpha]KAG7926026.1 hypothetical protein KL925_003788 [Ogataea polymorpha]KAG7933968.1 hypothetical protein KL934_002890 [Ogataea polymorpha]